MAECSGVRLQRNRDIRHNESSEQLVCGGDSTSNASFKVEKKDDGSTYVVAVNSWSLVPLWRDGYVAIDTKNWTMTGYLDGFFSDSEWLFCDPKSVVNSMIAGLECYVKDMTIDEKDRNEADTLLTGIQSNRNNLIANAHRYPDAEDCKKNPIADEVPTSHD